MKKKNRAVIITTIIITVTTFFSSTLYSESQRVIPSLNEPVTLKIEFNRDSLKGFYLILDFRTPEEKKRDTDKQSLAGDVIVYFQGHTQRPDDGYILTSKLAAQSKSGVVIIPVCDTPFGTRTGWRGDEGKDIILMEIVRTALSTLGITIKNYKPFTDMNVTINNQDIRTPLPGTIPAELTLIGWSHGALLSRRIASAYPDCVNSLVQMESAGFVDWGGEYCVGPSCMSSRFALETSCIGLGIFRGEGAYVFDLGWGGAKGLFGDTGRSCSSCISGNFSFLKPFRFYKDGKDCTVYADDKNFPVSKVKNISVIFAVDDSLFKYDDHAGIKDPENVTQKENELFFTKYYNAAFKSGAKCTLAVLPGNHIGPMVNSEIFAKTALTSISQMK